MKITRLTIPVAALCLLGGRVGVALAEGPVVDFVAPDGISLAKLRQTELQGANQAVLDILAKADELVRRGVRYRPSKLVDGLDREDLPQFQPKLSCSEFVWYVLSLTGLDLGGRHLETRKLAYQEQVYPKALERVVDGSIKPGDMLVYVPPPDKLGQKTRSGKTPTGHVVIVVSVSEKIVVGSHYRTSTPRPAPTGAGYRRLLKGWDQWTADRKLQAIYRVKSGWKSPDGSAPERADSDAKATEAPEAAAPTSAAASGPLDAQPTADSQ